jgi:hypothetical protein
MSVPCNGCRLCCINDLVRILPHEDASQWRTQPHPLRKYALMLAHKADGTCVYLGESGCTIHDQPRPQQCVDMDCRNIAARMSWTQARRAGVIRVWRRGKELILAGRGE